MCICIGTDVEVREQLCGICFSFHQTQVICIVCWAYGAGVEPFLFLKKWFQGTWKTVSFNLALNLQQSSCPQPPSRGTCLVPSIAARAKAVLYLDKDFGLCFQGLGIGEHVVLWLCSKYGPWPVWYQQADHESGAFLWHCFLGKSVEQKELKGWGMLSPIFWREKRWLVY